MVSPSQRQSRSVYLARYTTPVLTSLALMKLILNNPKFVNNLRLVESAVFGDIVALSQPIVCYGYWLAVFVLPGNQCKHFAVSSIRFVEAIMPHSRGAVLAVCAIYRSEHRKHFKTFPAFNQGNHRLVEGARSSRKLSLNAIRDQLYARRRESLHLVGYCSPVRGANCADAVILAVLVHNARYIFDLICIHYSTSSLIISFSISANRSRAIAAPASLSPSRSVIRG
nr:MAG TPA: hypothetical protein [Bacteriophage sp.]